MHDDTVTCIVGYEPCDYFKGYGHSTPETILGKLFCMMFALAGIPLGLVMFQSIGERVNTGIAACLRKIRAITLTKGVKLITDVTPTHLLIVSLSIGSMVIVIGTYVFHRAERWTMFEAYYYCVISLSTIGFGDYVPLQVNGILQKDPGYVAFTLLFIICGLAFFSASVNLLVLGFMAPNANVVTSSREPPRAVVFETFAPTRNASLPSRGSNVTRETFDSPKLISLNSSSDGRKMNASEDSCRMLKSLEDLQDIPDTCKSESELREDVLQRIFHCTCNHPSHLEKKLSYTTRRMPITHIDHLVNHRSSTSL
ncbi:hypothetical protein AB6A40_001842 [Gnathostoma spinigerum]|uniref:Potassium channel domain-containing protein n=1 Tax=Gnathostoma spinigerum TaxID=75299 RepID=A0ABD6EE60_9BILA